VRSRLNRSQNGFVTTQQGAPLIIASAFPLLFVIAAIVVLGVTHSLFAASPLVIAAQVGAIGLSVWARQSFSKGAFRIVAVPSGPSVIQRGPYRFIRHPMYSAALLFVWTAILSHLSVLNVTIGVAVTSVVVVRIVAEERLLRAVYPEYGEYTRSTKALVPFVV
jgi:protein-S-isoprenylcysteine O-methyltransferase Ste14